MPGLIAPTAPAAGPPWAAGHRATRCWPSCRGCGGASGAGHRASAASPSCRGGCGRAAEDLGPTFIKLGQIISSGEGLFPAELVEEFKRCRDQVPAESFDDVRAHRRGRPRPPARRGLRLVRDRRPLAAASIAQVHAARLTTGEEVVVKVQRPDVARLVHTDLRAMAWLAPHLVGRIPVAALANPPALVELFADTIVEELDFRIEAANMLDVATMLRDLDQDGYVVPRPHPRLVTRRVLVMQRLDGFKFDDVAGMRQAGVDTEGVVRTAMIALMEGAMVEGVFHGDLHGGNLFVRPDGRTALLDFGIVARLSDERRLAFLRLMLGATTNDLKGQMAALRDLGALPQDTDLRAVIRDLGLDQAPVDPTTLDRRPAREGGAARRQGAARLRRPDAQGADAVRQEPRVPRRRHRPPGARPRHPRRDRHHLDAVRPAPRRPARAASSASTRPSMTVDLDGVKAGFGLDPSVDRLTHRDLQARRALIQHRMRHRRLIRAFRAPVGSAGVRVVVARCSVDYDGRLSAHLPEALRLIMVKADGCVADPRRRRRLQAAQLDERPEHAGRGAATRGRSPTPRASG